MGRIEAWIHDRVTVPLAAGMIRLGILRRRRLLSLLLRLAPAAVGLAAIMAEAERARTICWWHPGPEAEDPEEDMRDLTEELARRIRRMPDGPFLILARRFGALPGEDGLGEDPDSEALERSLAARPPAGSWIWVGERRDLKGEEGLARLRRILEEIRPVPEAPVVYLVLISVPEAAERAVLEAMGLA